MNNKGRKMNSFKKIALVLVATLTMGTMTALPSNAAVSTSLKVNNASVATGTVSTNPTLLPVPADNSVDAVDALEIEVTGLNNNTVVSAVATNGRIVPAIATPTVPVTASSGSTSLAINTGTGTTADFFVYTTLATDGTIAVTIGGNTTTYYFKGTAGALNSITLSAPATAAAGTVEKVTVAGFDVFGNPKGGATINLQVISTTSVTTALTTEAATTATTVLGAKTTDIAIPASGTVTLVATASVASAVLGLAAPVGVVIKTITVRDLIAELAAVRAELAAEKAGRAADKVAADKALADAKAASDKALADAKAATDAAALKAAAELAVANSELSKLKVEISTLTAEIDSLNKALIALKKKYNAMAKKYKFKPVA